MKWRSVGLCFGFACLALGLGFGFWDALCFAIAIGSGWRAGCILASRVIHIKTRAFEYDGRGGEFARDVRIIMADRTFRRAGCGKRSAHFKIYVALIAMVLV